MGCTGGGDGEGGRRGGREPGQLHLRGLREPQLTVAMPRVATFAAPVAWRAVFTERMMDAMLKDGDVPSSKSARIGNPPPSRGRE